LRAVARRSNQSAQIMKLPQNEFTGLPGRIWLCALCCALTFAGFSQTDGIIGHQGRVSVGGVPFHGDGFFKFALIRNSGAETLWRNATDEDLNGEPDEFITVRVVRGLYETRLGDASLANMAPIPAAVFSESISGLATEPVHLRVWFDDGVHGFQLLSPDQRVGAVAYAMSAATVADGSVTISKLAPELLEALEGSPILQLAILQSQLNALSNRLDQSILASSEPADAELLAQGLVQFAQLEGPGWRDGASVNAPLARVGHTGVWTGSQFVIWGGAVAGEPSSSGGVYDPGDDSWTLTSPISAPGARGGHTAVWTGNRMLVWGGFAGGYLNTGGAYTPSTMNWTPLSTTGAPEGRQRHAAVWTGARMVIWGGQNGAGLLPDGAAYDDGEGVWTALPTSGAPSARRFPTAVWAGDRMIVFGGEGAGGALGTGGSLLFDSAQDPRAWLPLPAQDAPSARVGHTAVWTGSRMLVWGGLAGAASLGDGAALDPSTDTWTPIPTEGAPTPRSGHVAVWTGSEMLIFGGLVSGGPTRTGGAYNPATGKWRTLAEAGPPLPRSGAAGAWSGTELLVFGGLTSSSPATPIGSLQRLSPQPASYLYRKP
jgi:hypothetical protein